MDAETTKASPPGCLPWSRRAPGLAGTALLVVGLLVGCAEEPLPQRRLTVDDCLRQVRLDHLKEALQSCDAVVKAFPREPQPLNERFLLHSLAGNDAAACRDIAQAAALASKVPVQKLDRLIRNDLRLRVASCRN